MSPIVVEKTAGRPQGTFLSSSPDGRPPQQRGTQGHSWGAAPPTCLHREACLASEDFWQLRLLGPWHPSIRWSLQIGGLERG